MTDEKFSIAVFPFLKTFGPIQLGGYIFRSTTDLDGLSAEQATAISEIRLMLFAQDDLRVKSASYAILPDIEVHSGDRRIEHLANLRAVVSYFYSAPHEVFDYVFLAPEETSLVLFTPSRVSVFLTRPEHHTESVGPPTGATPDEHHYVSGYNGLYNFRHAFWVEPGSRIYGPKPHMGLNISQDLFSDLDHRIADRPDYRLLLDLLGKPNTPTSQRIYAALRWYNAANENGVDQSQALLNLAVAFETLLRLPESSKKDRLVDAIALLLGRTDRLNDWADQFYAARSRVAHEGQLHDGYFYVSGLNKQKQISDIFGSLMLYGRQVFQLCVGTVLVGIDLAERADLREKLVTNTERFQKICNILNAETDTPSERLLALEPIIRALERYRFVASEVSSGPQIEAVRLTAAALIADQTLSQDLADALEACAKIKRQDGQVRELETIERLNDVFKKSNLAALSREAQIARDVVDLAWMNLFRRYYWLKEQTRKKPPA